jgi:NAD-dependent deacetylase
MTSIDSAAALLHAASCISVLSGAGLSKASGIPTYRDTDGLWRDKNAVKFSHIDALKRDPEGFHSFWASRMAALSAAKPNPGHRALVELQMHRPGTALITQNVDGLLGDAGAQQIFELHGNLRRWRCDSCGDREGPWLSQRCPRCGAQARPDVVMFGEMLDEELLTRTQEVAAQSDVFLVVGTSAAVYPAADLPTIAASNGAKIITLNMEAIDIDGVAAVVLRGPAEELLPDLIQAARLRP